MDHNYHILSTALLPEDAAKQLSVNGILCDEVPFIKTEEAIDEDNSAFISALASQKRTIIFTSAQAVAAVTNCLNGVVPDWKIFCISGVTKSAVANYFGTGTIAGTGADALELIEQIRFLEKQECVFFCGNKRLDTIPEMLSAQGFEVKECEVYRTSLHPVKVKASYNAILFFSPSGVESFLSANDIEEQTVLFSIGRTTARVLEEKVKNKVIIAPQPDKHILVQIVIDFYPKQKK